MLLAKDIQVYLRASDTCNLNCHHCFTSGSRGARIFFDPVSTSNFLIRMAEERRLDSVRVIFHGGEPMLAPMRDLLDFHSRTRTRLPKVEYGIQTNLVYGLTPERLQFFREVVGYRGIGTSWDADIRFGSSRPGTAEAELKLWEKNVRTLVAEGHELTLMVSLSRTLLEKFRPAQVIQYAIDLGFRFILFERITADGNAVSGQGVMPSNAMLDSWILQMFDETREHAFHRKIGNMFLDELTQSILSGVHGGNRCRGCEQKLITIRADGSIAGCPNSASTERWGSIHEGPERILSSRGRVDAICTEKQRPMACLSCDLSRICNGDCYKLKWEGDLCAAPKSLMRRMLAETDSEFIRQLRL